MDISSTEKTFPLVSVRLMCYNHAEYIRQALDSILSQQTSFPIEVVVGDDYSSDTTPEIINEYVEKFPGIVKVLHRPIGGDYYTKRRKLGRLYNFTDIIAHCRGKYIALLDGDDYWIDPLKLQKQVDVLEKETEVIVCHHWQRYKIEGKEHESEAPKAGHGYLPQTIATVEDIFANKLRAKTRSMMFRNIISDDFFPDWYYKVAFGDVPLTFLLGKHGKFYFIDEEMAVYRITGKGVSSAGSEKPKEIFVREHFFNWIEIWDYANRHYGGAYRESAVKTITNFYLHILNNSRLNINSFSKILLHASCIKSFSYLNILNLFLKLFPLFKYRLKTKIKFFIAGNNGR